MRQAANPYLPTQDELSKMSVAALRRECDAAWDMAGLAHQDANPAEVERRSEQARAYQDEITRRLTGDH